MVFGVGGQAGRQTAFLRDPSQQDPHGVRDGQSEKGEFFSSVGFQLLIDADMQHLGLSAHLRSSGLCVSIAYLN